ncbi:MAG: SGNH/GDSL hydrolase family protein [bacterium]
MNPWLWIATLVVGLVATDAGLADGPRAAPLVDGDRWVVVGDSITFRGWYHRWVELFYVTRFPERRVTVLNRGIPADTAEGGLRRFGWDIMSSQPTAVTLMFGMNDVGRALYAPARREPGLQEERSERIDRYETAMCALVQMLQCSGVRPIVLTPSIYDQTAHKLPRENLKGVNDALAECGRRLVRLAERFGVPAIDFQRTMIEINARHQSPDPNFTIIGLDRVHPEPAGHLVMAYEILRAQGAPAYVAFVEIDARTGRVENSNNCRVENIQADPAGIRFDYHAGALPFPIHSSAAPALKWIPFTRDLNREVLQITGLASGAYELEIDGHRVDTFTSSELANGVNLALANTPQMLQASNVSGLLHLRL